MESNIEIKRHSLAHIMAMAIIEKHPGVKLGIGPAIENGFYYDFDFPESDHLPSEEKLPSLESFIKELISKDIKFEKGEVSAEEARKIFSSEPYKLELLDELAKNGKKISIYKSRLPAGGPEFIDLCAGPHVESAKEINPGSFKLTKIAGAYWRGNEKNQMLTRIYGVAFETKKELEEYLKKIEEAEKRDHRVLAEKLDLFMISEEVGKGLPLWLPNGAFIRKKMEDYMYEKEFNHGYKYVYTPVLTKKGLYEKSGHLAHYKDDMYNPIDIEGEKYYLKPMNCPHHHMLYKHKPLSYRDLPLRLAEFGLVHRFERSGVLTGLIRARGFTQNDSHIYCKKDQLKDELVEVLKLFGEVYSDFKITDYWFRLSLPDFGKKEKYGDIEDKTMWEESILAAKNALDSYGVKYVEGTGEATFYGPKIDVQIKNVMDKEDTIATAQVDFYSAKRFDLFFTNEKGEKERPVIIHRAIMGSFDRFFAFLTEKTAGDFPLWLAPIQTVIVPVSEKFSDYGKKVLSELQKAGIRAELDNDSETLGKRIRNAETKKIPYILVVGEKEIANESVAVRSRSKKDEGAEGVMALVNFIEKLQKEILEKI